MATIPLKVATYSYDITRALFDGEVEIAGAEASFETAPIVSDIFEGMVRDKAFDVAELGLTFYLRTLDLDDPPFIALPIFPNRQFRHSAIYVNRDSGIESPADLAGKVIGEFATYGHDAGVVAKGILADEYGFRPEQARWLVGGFDWPMAPFDFTPFLHPDEVEVAPVAEGKVLGPMLDAGEIDALISANVPRCVIEGSPRVTRLFPDYEALERDYFRRTGIFPAMHTVVVRRDLLEAEPGLARAVYDAFCAAMEAAFERYRRQRMFNFMSFQIPWMGGLFDQNAELFGNDLWAYGMEANRKMVDTWLRWHHEQGLSRRRPSPEEIFAEELLDT